MTEQIFKGRKFCSFSEFSSVLDKYCDEERQIFTIHDSKILYQKNYVSSVNLSLKYSKLTYTCKFGEEVAPKGEGIRKRKYVLQFLICM